MTSYVCNVDMLVDHSTFYDVEIHVKRKGCGAKGEVIDVLVVHGTIANSMSKESYVISLLNTRHGNIYCTHGHLLYMVESL